MAHAVTGSLTDWVDAHLETRRTGPLVLVRERTWGSVWTAATEAGPVWVKQAAPSTAFEVRLYPLLARHAPDHVLHPLAADPDRRLVLLPDAGSSFVQRFTDGALTSAMAGAVAGYGAFQRRVAAAVTDDELLALGLVDMRPERMPARFDEAAAFARDVARASGTDHDLVDDLIAARGQFAERCGRLAAHGRPAGIDHNDLHAANVVGDPARPRFYDWGDAVLAHPFACLLTPLDTLPDDAADPVRTAYLAGFGDPEGLADEARLACEVAVVARALVWLRALGPHPAEHDHVHAPFAPPAAGAHRAGLKRHVVRSGCRACDRHVRGRGIAQIGP